MIARRSGAFVNADPVHLQSTGFVLDPKGDVVVSVYSSSAIGKLVPDDVIGLAHYLRPHIFLDGHTFAATQNTLRVAVHIALLVSF